MVAQQVMDIQRAIAAKKTAFTFEGTDLQLKWSAWCAITMNPGYAGRSELPDNLKVRERGKGVCVRERGCGCVPTRLLEEVVLSSSLTSPHLPSLPTPPPHFLRHSSAPWR